jgi:hypothetical protein
MPDGSAGGGFSTFQVLLLKRVTQLAQEWSGHEESKFVPMVPKGKSHFIMPIGLVMVVDEANGGNATAQELVRRFDLLHRESGQSHRFLFHGLGLDKRDRPYSGHSFRSGKIS